MLKSVTQIPFIMKSRIRKLYRFMRKRLDTDQYALFQTSREMLKIYLGEKSFMRRVNKSSTFFGVDSDEGRQLLAFRVINFAEKLYNLQFNKGFEHLLKKIRDEKDTASVFAEMEAAMFFREHQFDVQFMEENSAEGQGFNYDLKVLMKGRVVAVEVKGKVARTEVSTKTLFRQLKSARTQLPKGKPGLIFVRFPKDWIGDFLRQEPFEAAVKEFFDGRNTRVIAICGYTEIRGLDMPYIQPEPRAARIYANPVQVHGDILSCMDGPLRMRRDNYKSVQVVIGLAPEFSEQQDEWDLARYNAKHPEDD